MQSDDFGSEFASWVCSGELGSDAVLPRSPCKGCANAFLSQERYFYLFLAHPGVQQDSLWEDTEREKPHPEGRVRREKDTSPNNLFWLMVFVVRFGLVVWWFVFFLSLFFVLLL